MKPTKRFSPEGIVPLLAFEGTSFECGVQLGMAWRQTLHHNASLARDRWTPWWRKGLGARLAQQRAPHLVDIYRGMAKGAGIDEEVCGYTPYSAPLEGCTSFAVHEKLTVDGAGLAGQTKDTPRNRTFLYQVIRLKTSDAPGLLTLTYPGELIGYGFAENGMAIFRNSLFVTPKESSGELPFDAFGMLAHFASSLDEVVELARKHGVRIVGHMTIADPTGRAVGLELCQGDVGVIKGRDGLYVHANHAIAEKFKPLVTRKDREEERGGASVHRQSRLYELMEQSRGRLTPQMMLQNLSDHANYPRSICSHRGQEYHTTAAVVVEPSRGLLHVTRGAPCQNWPVTYRL